jgi:DNA-binding beta-propeller fold protein YncE
VVAGGDTQFADRGVHELRGVPGEWRVYEVEETARDRAVPVEALAEPATARRRNWPLVIAVVAGVATAAALATAIALASLSRPAPIVPHADSVLRLNTLDGSFAALVDVQDPTDMAVEGDALWVLSASGRTVNRVPTSGGAAQAVGLPATPTGLAIGDGAVWITFGFGSATGAGGVSRVGMTSRSIENSIDLGNGVDGIALGEGAVWVTNRLQNSLTRIDLTTQVATGTTPMGQQPGAVAVGDDSVWVANAIDRTIWRIDPASMERTAEVSVADAPYDLALGFGRLWVTSELAGSVTVIDTTTNSIQRTLTMPGAARGISAGANEMVVAIGSGDVALIDPDNPDEFRQISVGAAPYDVAASDAGVWVSLRE